MSDPTPPLSVPHAPRADTGVAAYLGMSRLRFRLWVTGLLAALVVLLLWHRIFIPIGSGESGVLWSRLGGGTVMDDDSWQTLTRLGTTVWLNPPPEEIARRIGKDEADLAKRPLLADVLQQKDKEARHKLLSERVKALIGNRSERYRQAEIVVSDSFSTPESTAKLIRETLQKAGVLTNSTAQKPYDRWGIL